MPATYKNLLTYWYSLLICDLTFEFCEKWIRSFKLSEQMTGAARSGKQNIVEGSESLKTSLKTGIKLTNVAKASLEELLADYEDFLRQRGLQEWGKEDLRTQANRRLARAITSYLSYSGDSGLVRKKMPLPKEPEAAANLLVTLCHLATYLMSHQVEALEEKHKKEGGYTEKLYRERTKWREIGGGISTSRRF